MNNHCQTDINEQMAECRENWFQNHKAKSSTTSMVLGDSTIGLGTTIINWQNPNSWNYGCVFIIHKRWLIVTGDIGEAVYEWSSDITLEFLGGIDFSYFHSKCQSSEVGRHFTDWNEHVAKQYRADRIAEIKAKDADDRSEGDDKALEVLEDLTEFDKHSFKAAAQEYYDEHGDGEGAQDIGDMGEVAHPRCIGHFIGLQMAIKQLEALK